MIYRDEQGRKTTALTSTKNTIFIPNENSITQNIINVNIPTTQKPPIWATTYKFGLKVNTATYETIPINIFYVDGIFRWLKIDGENKNKVKVSDTLIVKKDLIGAKPNIVKVKVLELKEQAANFLTTNGSITEEAGLYAKIKQSNFEMQYQPNEFVSYNSSNSSTGNPLAVIGNFTEVKDGVTVDRPFAQGAVISLYFENNRSNDDPHVVYAKPFVAQQYYDNFKQFFDTQIAPGLFAAQN